tara:strand:- start:495 stop:1460 length:966 start_codon:yes stop_codon:yes gene_type:complete
LKVLITGISGQDGIFLTNKLLESHKDITIYGTSRNYNEKKFLKNLKSVSNSANFSDVIIKNINLLDSNSVENMVDEIRPDLLFNLSGPSSVYESLKNPNIKKQIGKIFDNLINAGIKKNNFFKFFQASSSEMFNQHVNEKLNENSMFNPISPYAEGKLEVHKKIENIKKEYNWKISSGIMFNHESEFRHNDYLFMKIIKSAIEIKNNKKNNLIVGSLDLVRDWSFAGDFAEAIYLICLDGNGENYVIGSGVGQSINDLVRIIFEHFNLDPEEFIEVDSANLRPGDPLEIVSDPSKIKDELNWETSLGFEDLILRCIKRGNF